MGLDGPLKRWLYNGSSIIIQVGNDLYKGEYFGIIIKLGSNRSTSVLGELLCPKFLLQKTLQSEFSMWIWDLITYLLTTASKILCLQTSHLLSHSHFSDPTNRMSSLIEPYLLLVCLGVFCHQDLIAPGILLKFVQLLFYFVNEYFRLGGCVQVFGLFFFFLSRATWPLFHASSVLSFPKINDGLYMTWVSCSKHSVYLFTGISYVNHSTYVVPWCLGIWYSLRSIMFSGNYHNFSVNIHFEMYWLLDLLLLLLLLLLFLLPLEFHIKW